MHKFRFFYLEVLENLIVNNLKIKFTISYYFRNSSDFKYGLIQNLKNTIRYLFLCLFSSESFSFVFFLLALLNWLPTQRWEDFWKPQSTRLHTSKSRGRASLTHKPQNISLFININFYHPWIKRDGILCLLFIFVFCDSRIVPGTYKSLN